MKNKTKTKHVNHGLKEKIVNALNKFLSSDDGMALLSKWAQPTIADYQDRIVHSLGSLLTQYCCICYYKEKGDIVHVQQFKDELTKTMDDIYGFSPTQFGGTRVHQLAVDKCFKSLGIDSIENLWVYTSPRIWQCIPSIAPEETRALVHQCYASLNNIQEIIAAVDCQKLDNFIKEL